MPWQAYTQTVGCPLPLLEARLESVPEMGYDALAAPPRGELIIRGPVVFQGYYRDEAATREARPSRLGANVMCVSSARVEGQDQGIGLGIWACRHAATC